MSPALVRTKPGRWCQAQVLLIAVPALRMREPLRDLVPTWLALPGRSGGAVGSARMACIVTAFATVSCARPPPVPSPLPQAQRVDDRVIFRSVAGVEGCLRAVLDGPAGSVAGITPTTTSMRWQEGVRIEQWFITPPTHQRTVFELSAEAPDRTRVVVYVLQRHGQYEVGGFAPAAVDTVARCASRG